MLSETDTLNCAWQLTEAIEAIRQRHGWHGSDIVSIALAAATETAARHLGPAQTARLFGDHAKRLESEHLRRATS